MSGKRIFDDYLEDILQYAKKAIHFLDEIPTIDASQRDERTLLAEAYPISVNPLYKLSPI